MQTTAYIEQRLSAYLHRLDCIDDVDAIAKRIQ